MEYIEAREKFLVESMGIKFYRIAVGMIYTDKGIFSEWEYFGKLYNWAQEQPFWGHFMNEFGTDDGIQGPLHYSLPQQLVDPEAFAEFVYMFLTEEIEGVQH